jgi:hypothetical protein
MRHNTLRSLHLTPSFTGGSSHFVIAGLVPAIPIIWHCAFQIEIAGDKPGDDAMSAPVARITQA